MFRVSSICIVLLYVLIICIFIIMYLNDFICIVLYYVYMFPIFKLFVCFVIQCEPIRFWDPNLGT
jgi:hypothetical protein